MTNEHSWFIQRIESAIADGLSPDERARFDAHAAECEPCASLLADARAEDRRLAELFADARPSEDFEQRVIDRLRDASAPRRRIHPAVRRAALAAAAMLLIGTSGYLYENEIRPALPEYNAITKNDVQFAAMTPSTQPVAMNFPTAIIEREAEQKNFPIINKERGGGRDKEWGAIANDGLATGKTGNADEAFSGDQVVVNGLVVNGGSSQGEAPPSDLRIHRIDKLDFYHHAPAPVHSSTGDFTKVPTAGVPGTISHAEEKKTLVRTATPGAPAAASPNYPLDSVLLPTVDDDSDVDTKKADADKIADDFQAAAGVDSPQQAKEKNGPSGQTPPQISPTPQPALPATSESIDRKIIRTGSMEFEVDSYDSAAARLQKIVEEENGFIGSTDSNRLANGKMCGSISVRVPPENLDVLVLKLRGLGDLKSQKITADDVTKQYTDMDSELRAARAMETRLLAIIKDGKGEVKDLLEAEKELAIWRGKIESVEGEMRYINSQVALSTLAIALTERDIKTASAAFESEQVTLSLEADKVDEAYVKAKDAIADAKGRIIQSELKQYEPGQYGAKIVADVGPDETEALIGRLRQFPGRIATFNRERKQTTEDGGSAPLGIKIEQRDTRFEITLYNVALIAPRRTTSVTLASADVDQSVGQIQSAVTGAGGRMLSATTSRPNVNQVSSDLHFEVPVDKADAVLQALRAAGEVAKLETADNSDTVNSTTVKQGFAVQVLSFAMVFPRDIYTRELATKEVEASHQAILNAARGVKARIIASSLSQPDQSNVTAFLDFEIARGDQTAVERAIELAGETIASKNDRNDDGDNVVNDKVEYKISLLNAERLAPRKVTTLSLEAGDVEQAMNDVVADAVADQGRSLESTVSKDNDGRSTAHVIIDVPLEQNDGMLAKLRKLAEVRGIESTSNPQVPDGKLARARFDVTLANPEGLVQKGNDPWSKIRDGLSTGLLGLLTMVEYLIIGLFITGPFIFIWALWRVARRKRPAAKPTPVVRT